MKLRKKRVILVGLVCLCVVASTYFVQRTILKGIVNERKRDAQVILDLFHESLIDRFSEMNYAKKLTPTFAYGSVNTELFEEKATVLLQENEHVVYLAYFNGDMLDTILPKEEYSSALGKSLGDFSYSYTLAKVVKDGVIEGPERLETNDKNVFLFVQPIIENNEYMGEVVAALDAEYVTQQMNLEFLSNGEYDYELWRVNEIGEYKTIIATSNKLLDFSDALKLDFSLPANWNISIQPKDDWLSTAERAVIVSICVFGATLILFAFGALFFSIRKMDELLYANYMDPNCNMFTVEGFSHFFNKRIHKDENIYANVLYVHLSGYHDISLDISHEEKLDYFMQMHKSIEENFGSDVITARLSEEVIALAFFGKLDKEEMEKAIEDFLIQLFLKKKVGGKKMFVEPKSSLVFYPKDGGNATELLEKAYAKYHQLFKDNE